MLQIQEVLSDLKRAINPIKWTMNADTEEIASDHTISTVHPTSAFIPVIHLWKQLQLRNQINLNATGEFYDRRFAICCWWNNYWITKGDFSWIMKSKKYPRKCSLCTRLTMESTSFITSHEKARKEFFYYVLSLRNCLIINSNQRPKERSAQWSGKMRIRATLAANRSEFLKKFTVMFASCS